MADTETEIMFKELDDSAEHKALLKAAKTYARAKSQRAEILSTAKEKEDNAMGKLIALMHENRLSKFKHDGITAELIMSKEKAQVRINDDEEEQEQDED